MVRYSIKVEDTASDMININVRYVAEYNEKYARKLENEIYRKIDSLEWFPYRNAIINIKGSINEYRKQLVAKRYYLIYTIKKLEIHITHFIDCKSKNKNLVLIYLI